MKEESVKLLGNEIFVRHRIKEGGEPTLLFIHGIGESGRSFFDAFGLPQSYNIIVPDLLGFGKSQKVKDNPDYSFSRQIRIIWELIDRFCLNEIVLVAHSYGGILGTLMCREDDNHKIRKYLNVEGGIARDTTILSLKAVRALDEFNNDMGEFGHWLREGEFRKILLEDNESPSTIKCFDSVTECDPAAFAQTAAEICSRFESEDEDGVNEISQDYKDITIPKLYCVGTRPVMESARRFLTKNNLECRGFDVASHWLMLDKREEFYSFLKEFAEA